MIPHNSGPASASYSEPFNPLSGTATVHTAGQSSTPPQTGTRKETHVASYYQDGKLQDREILGRALYKKGELKKQESTTRQTIDSQTFVR